MPRIIYAEQNGTRHEVELPDGVSAMQGAVCHVHVDSAWLDRLDAIGDAEASMLSFADGAKPNSRLACQIKMSNELDGLVVELPEAQH